MPGKAPVVSSQPWAGVRLRHELDSVWNRSCSVAGTQQGAPSPRCWGARGSLLLCQGSCWTDRSVSAFQPSNWLWPREAGEILVVYFKIWLPGQLHVQTKACLTGRWPQCPAACSSALKVSNCTPTFPTLSGGIESSLSCSPPVSIPSWGELHL